MTPTDKHVQIQQIVQTPSRLRRADQAVRTDPIPVEMYSLHRSHRFYSVRYTSMKVVTTQIPFRLNMYMSLRSTRSHLAHKCK